MTPIQSIDLAALGAVPQAAGPQAPVAAYDVARFQEAYANAANATPVASPAAGLLNTAVVVTGTVGASRHALLSSGAAAAEAVGTVTKATAAIAERSRALSLTRMRSPSR